MLCGGWKAVPPIISPVHSLICVTMHNQREGEKIRSIISIINCLHVHTYARCAVRLECWTSPELTCWLGQAANGSQVATKILVELPSIPFTKQQAVSVAKFSPPHRVRLEGNRNHGVKFQDQGKGNQHFLPHKCISYPNLKVISSRTVEEMQVHSRNRGLCNSIVYSFPACMRSRLITFCFPCDSEKGN